MNQPELSRVGKYEILGLLGEGGMARVYRARMQGLARATKNVALKLIHAHLGQEHDFVLMFLDEMRLAMALEHRNIVQTFDAGRCPEGYYLVMELVEGATLRSLLDVINGRELLPLELCLFIGMEVCAALEFAHNFRWSDGRGANIVHRDVSPGNVLLSTQGDVKLADFGVAKAVGGLALSHAYSIKGKLSYMAPEQARGESGRRSDLFSVGAVLYEMICGRPVRGDVPLGKVAAGEAEIILPSSLRSGLSRPLEQLLLSCLASDSLKRPGSAEEIRTVLAEELFQRQLAAGSVLDAHAGLRNFLAMHGGTAVPEAAGETDTVNRVARALLEMAQLGHADDGADDCDTEVQHPRDTEVQHPGAKDDDEALVTPVVIDNERTKFNAEGATQRVSFPLIPCSSISLLEDGDSRAVKLAQTDPGESVVRDAGTGAAEIDPTEPNGIIEEERSSTPTQVSQPPHWEPFETTMASRLWWRQPKVRALLSGVLTAVMVAGLVGAAVWLMHRRRPTAELTGGSSVRGAAPARSADLTPGHDKERLDGTDTTTPASAPSSQVAPATLPARSSLGTRLPKTKRRPPGRLSVRSKPRAFVYVDGVLRGETPLDDLELSPGRHRLKLVSQKLHKSRSLKVLVRSGVHLRKKINLR